MEGSGNATQDALANLKQYVCDSGEVLSELLTILQKEDDRLLEIKCGLEITWDAFKVPEEKRRIESFPFILFELKFNGKKLDNNAQSKRRRKIATSFRKMVQKIDVRLHVSVFKSRGNERSFLAFDLDKSLDLVTSSLDPHLFEKSASNEVKSALEGIQTRLMEHHKADEIQCQGFIKMFITIILKQVFFYHKKHFRKRAAPKCLQILYDHVDNTPRAKPVEDIKPDLLACKKYIMILLHQAGVVSDQIFKGFYENPKATDQEQSGSPINGPETPNEGEVNPRNGHLSFHFQVQSMHDDIGCIINGIPEPMTTGEAEPMEEDPVALVNDNPRSMPWNDGYPSQPQTGEENILIWPGDATLPSFCPHETYHWPQE
eukprot:jgi/Picsp_1/44/NSC_00044-R1_---NA---